MRKLPSLLVLFALAALSAAQTSTAYRVTQSVGSLSLAQPGIADPYLFLDFQLTDGAGTGNGNSAVTVSNLRLSGGAFDYDDRRLSDIGNVVGSGDAFTLFGDAPLSDRAVLFRVTDPNAVLSYDLTLFQSGTDAPTPDGFSVALLRRTGAGTNDFNVVPTLGPTGNELVGYVFDGQATTRPLGYAVDPVTVALRVPTVEAPRYAGLGVPVVTVQAVPEPASLAALGVGALAALRRRRG